MLTVLFDGENALMPMIDSSLRNFVPRISGLIKAHGEESVGCHYALTALITAKLKTGVSVVVPPVVRNVMLKLPAATAVTIRS